MMKWKWSIVVLLLILTTNLGIVLSDFHITEGLRCYHCNNCNRPRKTDIITCPPTHKCFKEYGINLADDWYWIVRKCINKTEADIIDSDKRFGCDDNFSEGQSTKKCVCDIDFCNEASAILTKFSGAQLLNSFLVSFGAYLFGRVLQ